MVVASWFGVVVGGVSLAWGLFLAAPRGGACPGGDSLGGVFVGVSSVVLLRAGWVVPWLRDRLGGAVGSHAVGSRAVFCMWAVAGGAGFALRVGRGPLQWPGQGPLRLLPMGGSRARSPGSARRVKHQSRSRKFVDVCWPEVQRKFMLFVLGE